MVAAVERSPPLEVPPHPPMVPPHPRPPLLVPYSSPSHCAFLLSLLLASDGFGVGSIYASICFSWSCAGWKDHYSDPFGTPWFVPLFSSGTSRHLEKVVTPTVALKVENTSWLVLLLTFGPSSGPMLSSAPVRSFLYIYPWQ